MAKLKSGSRDIETYIKGFEPETGRILRKIRELLREMIPDGEEAMGYGVPAMKKRGPVIYYAGFKKHIGMYPPVQGEGKLAEDLKPYAGPKGNLNFPLDQPMPWELIKRVVKYHIKRESGSAQ